MSPQSDLFYEQSLAPLNSQSGDPDLHQWFTPFWAAEMFANDVLDGLGHVGVIEPSCGTGSFLSAIPQHLPAYGVDIDPDIAAVRSEEHTSELQSLMRISYAVFCLKKKKKHRDK